MTVDEAFCGAIVNAADVSASNETGDGARQQRVERASPTRSSARSPTPPDLQVSKSSDADGILHEGDDFLYTITVTNVGDEDGNGRGTGRRAAGRAR